MTTTQNRTCPVAWCTRDHEAEAARQIALHRQHVREGYATDSAAELAVLDQDIAADRDVHESANFITLGSGYVVIDSGGANGPGIYADFPPQSEIVTGEAARHFAHALLAAADRLDEIVTQA